METRGCVIEDCNKIHYGKGYCNTHYMRLWRNQTLELKTKANWHDDPSYSTMHKRLHRERGRAKHQDCVDCGTTAHSWSYNHDSENELEGDGNRGQIFKYGTSLDDYSPRCMPCHKKFDLEIINAR